MPIQINVTSGNVSGGTLTWGCNFEWVNPTSAVANLTCCGAFATQSSYSVPAASGGQNGIVAAQLNSGFQFVFGSSAYNAPGMPHISNPPTAMVNPGEELGEEHEHREKDVA
jgi:hypothetical protein